MKRLFCTLLALLLFSSAFAEIDLKSMTVEELLALRDDIDAELLTREAPEAGDVIHENSEIRIVLDGYEIGYDAWTRKPTVTFTVTWTNLADTSERLNSYLNAEAYADGAEVHVSWDYSTYTQKIKPGKSSTTTVTCYPDKDAETLEMVFVPHYGEEYKTYMIDLR